MDKIKIDKDFFYELAEVLSGREIVHLLEILFLATPGTGRLKKKDIAGIPRFTIDRFLDLKLIEIVKTRASEREYIRIKPEIVEKVSLNKFILREMSRQRKAEYRAKIGNKPVPSEKKWTAKKVIDLLRENNWSMSAAAESIGIKRQYISFLSKKYEIKKPPRP